MQRPQESDDILNPPTAQEPFLYLIIPMLLFTQQSNIKVGLFTERARYGSHKNLTIVPCLPPAQLRSATFITHSPCLRADAPGDDDGPVSDPEVVGKLPEAVRAEEGILMRTVSPPDAAAPELCPPSGLCERCFSSFFFRRSKSFLFILFHILFSSSDNGPEFAWV